MLVQITYNLGPLQMPMFPGDIINGVELDPLAIANAAGVAYTGAQFGPTDINRSGAAAVSDTLPTADDLIKSMIGSVNLISPPANSLYGILPNQAVALAWPANVMPLMPGSSFRRTIYNNNTGLLTLAVPANAGISLVGTTTIATVLWREYLVKILNSSPAVTLSCTTSTNTLLTNVDTTLINNVTPGMSVYGAGIAAATKVAAVNRDTGTITLDTATTATANNVGVTFTPTVTVRGLRSGTV